MFSSPTLQTVIICSPIREWSAARKKIQPLFSAINISFLRRYWNQKIFKVVPYYIMVFHTCKWILFISLKFFLKWTLRVHFCLFPDEIALVGNFRLRDPLTLPKIVVWPPLTHKRHMHDLVMLSNGTYIILICSQPGTRYLVPHSLILSATTRYLVPDFLVPW